MFTPDHAFVVEEDGGGLELISESSWHSRLFYNKHVRCDKSTNWEWRFDNNWEQSETIDEEVYIIDHQFRYQYFHWIMDCLPKIWLLKNYLPRMPKIALGSTFGNFQAASLALYGIDYEQCVQLQPNRVIRFERAIIPAFEFVEPLKTRRPGFESGVWNVGWSHEFLADLRERAILTCKKALDSKLRIFVSRSDAEHRKLINEPALLDFLLQEGFTVVTPGEHSFAQQIEIFAGASVIVGVHGAGLTNLVWAAPGCTVIELAPDGLQDVGYRFTSQLCGHQFGTILCRALEHPRGLAYSDIEVDLNAVRRAFRELSLSARYSATDSAPSGEVVLGAGVATQVFTAAEEAYAAGAIEKALKLALEYCERRPTNYWGHFLVGKIYRDQSETSLMERAFRAAIATAERDRIGAYFELANWQIRNCDFSGIALLDDALALSEFTEQRHWYYANLHFLKALVALAAEDLDIAEGHLATAYAFELPAREGDFLFDWVPDALNRTDWAPHRPYLCYLQTIASMRDGKTAERAIGQRSAEYVDAKAVADRSYLDLLSAIFRRDLLSAVQPDATLEAFDGLEAWQDWASHNPWVGDRSHIESIPDYVRQNGVRSIWYGEVRGAAVSVTGDASYAEISVNGIPQWPRAVLDLLAAMRVTVNPHAARI